MSNLEYEKYLEQIEEAKQEKNYSIKNEINSIIVSCHKLLKLLEMDENDLLGIKPDDEHSKVLEDPDVRD